MKVLLVSASDIEGGAARATYRLHQSLQSFGISSQITVQTKHIEDKNIIGLPSGYGFEKVITGSRLILDALPLKLYPNKERSNHFSVQWLPNNLSSQVYEIQPDIVNLHWVCCSHVQIEALAKINKPIVWTMHDMWPFTGGCHYSSNCERYKESCGTCPQISSSRNWDLSRWIWQRKSKAWKNLNLTIVSPSSWLAKCASSSSLFKNLRIEVIPNSLDTDIYRPIVKNTARELLKLPQDKQLVLFGSVCATSNKRKGFHLLQPALQKLSKAGWKDKIELVIFGSSEPEQPLDLGFSVHYLGTLNDDLSTVLAYSSADLYVLPSVQDNLPNTVIEALACGNPCVAFNIGGMSDMIEHQQNGFLAKPFEIDDLAKGIAWILDDRERHQKLSNRAREKAEQEFRREIQARQYTELFNQILNKN
jgi:glycosyltransferase involved in cell wall biosynthesis